MPRFQKGQVGYWKGKKRYFKNPEERAIKIKENAKSNPNFGMKGKKATEEHKKHLRESHKHHKASNIAYLRILNEIPELEKQGFKCIPIGKVIPDIIAIKDNKIYAIEVERGKPNYTKYTNEIKDYYDDIIWILRKKNDI